MLNIQNFGLRLTEPMITTRELEGFLVKPRSPFILIANIEKEIWTKKPYFVPGSVKTHRYSNLQLRHHRLKISNFRLFNAFFVLKKLLVSFCSHTYLCRLSE